MNMYPALIILAGGKSSRMGKPKGLLKFKDSYWILSQIENFIGREIYIGLGYDAEKYFSTISWLKEAIHTPVAYKKKHVRVVINTNPKLGLFSNLQSVLRQLNNTEQALILPVDVPLFQHKAQEQIIHTNNLIVIPKYKESNGHPIKINRAFIQILLAIASKEVRLDHLIKKRKPSEISFIEVTDGFCIQNLNSPKDWQAFIST